MDDGTHVFERVDAILAQETARRGICAYRLRPPLLARRRGDWSISVGSGGLDDSLHAVGRSQTLDLVESLGEPVDQPGSEMGDALRLEALEALAADDASTAAGIVKALLRDDMDEQETRLRACRLLGLPDAGAPADGIEHLSFDAWVLKAALRNHGLRPHALAEAIIEANADDWRSFETDRGRVRFAFALQWDGDRPIALAKPYLELPQDENAIFNGEQLVVEGRTAPDTVLDVAIGGPLGRVISTGTDLDDRIIRSWRSTGDGISLRLDTVPVALATIHPAHAPHNGE